MYAVLCCAVASSQMGLGKTIQAISLLAHLACEEGVWGPHLIVVPTSVMLNWEMEFKKWYATRHTHTHTDTHAHTQPQTHTHTATSPACTFTW